MDMYMYKFVPSSTRILLRENSFTDHEPCVNNKFSGLAYCTVVLSLGKCTSYDPHVYVWFICYDIAIIYMYIQLIVNNI